MTLIYNESSAEITGVDLIGAEKVEKIDSARSATSENAADISPSGSGDKTEIERADRVLFVVDAAEDPGAGAYGEERAQLPADVPVTLVFNKCDLAPGLPLADTVAGPPRLHISALTGEGIGELRAHLEGCMGFQTVEGGAISVAKLSIPSWIMTCLSPRRGGKTPRARE